MSTLRHRFIRTAIAGGVAGVAFFWGVATIHFQVWPYGLLKTFQPKPAPTNVESLPYNRAHRSIFDLYQQPVDIVFLGDSITQQAPWYEMFPDIRLANRGIGGERFENIRSRLDDVLALNPRAVFLMGGVNGAGIESAPEAVEDVEYIVSTLQAEGIRVYIQSAIVPRGQAREYVLSLNAALANLAQQHRLRLIDLSPLSNAEGLRPDYSFDGVHLTGEGYRAWESILRPYVEAVRETNSSN